MHTYDLDTLITKARTSPRRFCDILVGEDLASWAPQKLPNTATFCEDMTMCLQKAKSEREALARFFAASALLYGAQEEVFLSLLPYVPELQLLRAYQWVLCPILCTGETHNKIALALCGWSAEEKAYTLPSLADVGECDEALKRAVTLAAQHYNISTAHFALFPLFQKNAIAGDSLGLPLFLAFCAAKEKRVLNIYATGALQYDESITEVGNIERKRNLCKNTPLIIPAPNACADMRTTFAAATIHDALKLCFAQYIEEIGRIQKDLQFPEYFIANLPSYSLESLSDMQQEICHKALEKSWYATCVLQKLSKMLKEWTGERNKGQKEHKILEILCTLYPWHKIKEYKEHASEAVWYMAMRHMRRCNHEGDYKQAVNIWNVSKGLYTSLKGRERHEEYIIGFSLYLGIRHNRFDFYFDPLQDLDEKFLKKIEVLWNEVEEDEIDVKPLTNFYGILGQHVAFGRKTEKALEYFKKSQAAMCEKSGADIRKTFSYMFFTYQDSAPCGENATRLLCESCAVEAIEDIFLHGEKFDDAFLLHRTLRYLADLQCDAKILHDINFIQFLQKIATMADTGHPWQLIYYNLGCIYYKMHEKELAEEAFRKSISLCKETMPIIKTMALLPLYGLWKMQALPVDTENIWRELKTVIDAELSSEHFKDIVTCDTLDCVFQYLNCNLVQIFPFNYR